ncbi:MAG: hypothetical protein IJD72_06025 [Alistipes sp.]|nr:hypothetical protein [Alistipes sp.]
MKSFNLCFILVAFLFSSCAATFKVANDDNIASVTITESGETITVYKADKDVFLKLKGGEFNLHDPYSKTYEVSNQAYARVTKTFDKKIGYVIAEKSGKEVNMSEELFQAIVKYVERNNEKLRNFTPWW